MHPNFPPADTVLIVELDGPAAEVRELVRDRRGDLPRTGATTVEVAQNDEQRMRIWRGRKAAFAAMGRVSPNYYVQDGVVPRTKLPEVLGRIRALSRAHRACGIGNVFHAGDGNLHPLICYDESIPGQSALAEEVAGEILTYCVEAGGSITGEHGVGADKKDYMPRMFSDDDLDVMQKVRDAHRPAAPLQSGEGAADAAPVRRGAGPLSRASGREGRTGRALLMLVASRRPGTAADAIDGVMPAHVVEPETPRRWPRRWRRRRGSGCRRSFAAAAPRSAGAVRPARRSGRQHRPPESA